MNFSSLIENIAISSFSIIVLKKGFGVKFHNSQTQWQNYRANDTLKVKVIQSCQTFCNPMNYTVHGILQARILEWVAIPFSRGSSQPRDQTQVSALQVDSLPAEPQGKPKNTGVDAYVLSRFSCIQLFVTPWTVAHQAPLSMVFSRQEYWSGSLSLLQRIFLAQESNWGILHCRQILYQLSYQENDTLEIMKFSAFQTYKAMGFLFTQNPCKWFKMKH